MHLFGSLRLPKYYVTYLLTLPSTLKTFIIHSSSNQRLFYIEHYNNMGHNWNIEIFFEKKHTEMNSRIDFVFSQQLV